MQMALKIKETDSSDVTRLSCPNCGEKVKYVGLLRSSAILGLTFRCKKCGKLWAVETDTNNQRPDAH